MAGSELVFGLMSSLFVLVSPAGLLDVCAALIGYIVVLGGEVFRGWWCLVGSD